MSIYYPLAKVPGISLTMVTTLHYHNVIPLRLGPGDLYGGLNCLRSRIPEEEAVQAWVGHHSQQ